MTADPFLLAHETLPDFFNLAGRLSPISIRDQMVRGQMLIDRAIDEGRISRAPNDLRPLLVVGAGAAGSTVAIHAAERGVPTAIIDRHAAPFRLQSACRSRFVDPTQYDWPADHWQQAHYPFIGSTLRVPLPWRGDVAYVLARDWHVRLYQAANRLRTLRLALSTIPVTSTPTVLMGSQIPRGWKVDFANPRDPLRITWSGWFGMIVWTVGFGVENHIAKLPNNRAYSGSPFWSTDAFQRPSCGVPNKPEVLISGAGDGGLQDYIRITTKKRAAKDILNFLPANVGLERRLQSAEDRAARGHHWGAKETHDHVVLRRIHEEHRDAVESIVRDPAVRSVLRNILDQYATSVKLVYSCDHFANAYPLNRFMVLLISRFIETEHDVQTLVPKTRLFDIQPSGNHKHCGYEHATCAGEDHEVELMDAPACWDRSKPGTTRKVDANFIVIRHGIDSTVLPGLQSIKFPRQLLPYNVPG